MTSLVGRRLAVVNWRDVWHPQAGGAEMYAWELAKGLARRGARVSYVTGRARGQARHGRRDGVEIIRRGGRFGIYPRVLAWMLAHRWSFDAVIDCQNGIPFFTPWVMPRRVPVFCAIHHVHDQQWGLHFAPWIAWIGRMLEGPVARRCYRRCACLTISLSSRDAIAGRLGWSNPVYFVPVGLTARQVAALTARQSAGADEASGPVPAQVPGPAGLGGRAREAAGQTGSGPRLVWVGRLVVQKRVERVLDVAERLRDRGVTIDVIGRGPASISLAAEVSRRGLSGVVRPVGFLPEPDKEALVASALLHLNTSQGEGWGLCVIEAAALGVPTVAYDVDGLRDAVRDGRTGWLARDGERIEDVVERAVKELSDPARRAEVSRACRAWAATFDWDHSAERLALLVAGAIQTGTAKGRREGTWVADYRDGNERRSVVLEGPALDVVADRLGSTILVRRATAAEQLLGRTDGAGWR